MLQIQTSAVSNQSFRLSITAGTVLRASTVSLRKPRTQQQTRNFRFGLWSSYLDQNYEKECRRRHRIVKHKYIEALNRKLSWDRHFPGHPKQYGFKGFMCSAWHNQDSRPGGRWVNIDGLRTPREESTKHSNEVNDWGDLRLQIQRFKASLNESLRVGSESLRHDPRRHMRGGPSPDSTSGSDNSPLQSQIYSHESLRRRFQAQKSSPDPEYTIDPITNRKVYKTSPAPIEEIAHDRTSIPVQTFRFYRSQFQGADPSSGDKFSGNFHGLASTVKACDPVQEGLKEFDSKVDYSEGALYDVSKCGIDYNNCAQAGLKEHDEKLSRKYCEADFSKESREGPPLDNKKSVGAVTESQDDVHSAINHYEATVTRPKDLLKAIQEYEAKRPRFPDALLKSDGKTHPLIQAIEEFESGKSKNGGQAMSDTMLDPLLRSIQEYYTELRMEKIMAEKSGRTIDRQLADVLKPIEEYQRSLSQARLRTGLVEEGLKDYDSKVDYSRGRRDSILRLAGEDKTEDLDLLRASDIRAASGIFRNTRMETEAEKSAKREELENAFRLSQDRQIPSEEESAAFRRVKELRSGQFERDILSNVQSSGSDQAQDAHVPESSATSSRRKLTGNFVRDFPEDFETTWQEQDSGSLMPKPESSQSNSQSVAPAYSPATSGHAGNPNAQRIETSLDRTTQQSSEKFESTMKAKSGSASLDAGDQCLDSFAARFGERGSINATELERDEDALARDVRSIYEQKYGTIDSQHRQLPDVQIAQDIPSPKVLNIASDKADHHPTLYKILAYDPTMQSISEAETTSIVEDSSTPLTPAEVLLRLSNPAKFFPHFLPLQSQGYEIVSGSGDVLVFRKVRSSGIYSNEIPVEGRSPSDEARRRKVTNPIDGMQRNAFAATGDFASPTGFVNHDLPRGSDPPYNVDVRREEPVFSGKSKWQGKSDEVPPRKSRGKKVLVSAVWVAGCCYAMGVVTEFFKNGGPDGLQGF